MLSKSWLRSNIPVDSAGKRLAVASLINNVGSVTQSTTFPLFLVLSAGIPAVRTGTGLLIAGVIGLAFSPLAGSLSDRYQPRRLLTGAYAAQAAVSSLLIFIHSFVQFCVLMSITAAAGQVGRVARMTLLASFPNETRNIVRSQVRVFGNTGMGVGVAFSGVILLFNTRDAYLTGFVLDAATYVAAWALQGSVRIDRVAGRRRAGDGSAPALTRRTVLRDFRYVVAVVLNGLLCIHQNILMLGIPLWVAATHHVPPVMATVVFLIDLAAVVLFQMRFSVPVLDVRTAARSWRKSGLAVAACCGLLLLADQVDSGVVPIVAVVAGAVCLSLGELWYSAAEFQVSVGLAPQDRMGAYQGFFALGQSSAQVLGTLVVTFFCVSLGNSGWIMLIVFFFVFSMVAPVVLRWVGGLSARRGYHGAA